MPQGLFAVFDRDGVFEFVKVRGVFNRVDFRTVSHPLECLLVRARRLVGDVHHLHLADIVLALDSRHGGDVGQAVEMPGLGDRAPEKTEMAIVRRQFVVSFHAGFEIVAPQPLLEVISGDRLQCDG